MLRRPFPKLNASKVMKTFTYVSVVIAAAALTACTSTNKLASAKVAAAQKTYQLKCRAIDAQTEAQKKEIIPVPGVLGVSDVEVLKARLDSLNELKKQKAEIDSRFQMLSEQNLGKADRIGLVRTGLGWSGLFAGVGAAALTAASPANLVWIAVLSGYAGGIAGMNSVMENNGLSRTQLAQLSASAVREFNEVNIQINFGELAICGVTTGAGCNGSEWERKFAEQQALVSRLQGILYGLDIPTLTNSE